MTPLVRIRCPACRTVLATVDEVPTDWSGVLTFRPCLKHTPDAHNLGTPKGRARWERWMTQQMSESGEAIATVRQTVPLAALRSLIDRACRDGKTMDEVVHPPDTPA